MHRFSAAVMALGLLVGAGTARAQTVDAGPVTVEFTGRLQLQFNTTSVGAAEVGAEAVPVDSRFETRRLRFGVELDYGDWVSAKLEPDYAAGKVSLKDAWVNLAFADALELRVGQFKKPFSVVELTSSTQIVPIERDVRIRGLEDAVSGPLGEEQFLLVEAGYISRDIGAALHGSAGALEYMVGVFNGSGANSAETDDHKSVAGRVVVTPAAGVPLRLGGAVSHQTLPVGSGLNRSSVEGVVLGADLEWGEFRRPGLHVMGEVMYGDNLLKLEPGVEREATTMVGGHLIAAGFIPVAGQRIEGVEIFGRASIGDPDTAVDDDAGLLLTPGVTLYFFGRNRLMFNWDVYTGDDRVADAQHAFRSQLQVYF